MSAADAPGTGSGAARAMSPALACRGLVKRYGALVAVAGLDLRVEAGECFGLLGPNGAGKTSTIEVLEGLQSPDAGHVEVLGLSWDRDAPELRQRLGVQLQETRLPERLTVAETIRLFRSFYRRGRSVATMLDVVQLNEKRDARVGKLSGGQRQRLAVACSLVGDPDLLFLDEPTTGLDPQSRLALWSLIEEYRALGRTVLLTTHYMEEAARLCDRVAIMDAGRILALDTPRRLVASLGGEHIVEIGVGAAMEPGRTARTGAASGAAADEPRDPAGEARGAGDGGVGDGAARGGGAGVGGPGVGGAGVGGAGVDGAGDGAASDSAVGVGSASDDAAGVGLASDDAAGVGSASDDAAGVGSARWVAALERLPGVTTVRADGDRLRLSVSAVDLALPALVSALQANGLRLTSLSTHEATLEDVFVHLTGRGLRDE